MAVTTAQLEQLYLAYFGRPADFDGIAFYTTGSWDIWQVANAFSASPESQRLYGTTFSAAQINAIYNNLFNRDAEPAGLLYWSQQVSSGALTVGEAALGILLGAQNDDLVTVNNKLAVATAFTAALDTAPEILGYTGDAAAQIARDFLATVTSNSTTVTTAEAAIDATIVAIVDVGGVAGQTFVMTTGVDNIVATNSIVIDTVQGTVDNNGTTDKSTFSAADKITGNGKTVVDLLVKAVPAANSNLPHVTMTDIKAVSITNATAVASQLHVDSSAWHNVGSITLTGLGGPAVYLSGLVNDTTNFNVKIAGATTGTIHASGVTAGSWNVAGSLYHYSTQSTDTSFSLNASGITMNVLNDDYGYWTVSRTTSSGTKDVSLGDVNLTTVGVNVGSDDAYLYIYQTATASKSHSASVGSINIGAITTTVATTGYAYESISNYAYATGTSATATVGNMNIGSITQTVGKSATAYLYAYNTASVDGIGAVATAGDVIVGSINLTGKTSAYVSDYLYNSAYADYGSAHAGNLDVGFIGVNLAKSGYASIELYNYAYAYAGTVSGSYTSASASVGNYTIGDISIVDGKAGTVYLYGTNSAQAWDSASLNDATVGDMSLGNITLSGKGYEYVDFYNFAEASHAATVGTMTVGNVTLSGATTTYHSVYLYNSASAYHGASVGDVTVGNLSVNSAYEGEIYVYQTASVWESGTASVGNMTVGNVSIATPVTKAGYNYVALTQAAYAGSGAATSAHASVGTMTVGAVSMNVASGTNELYVYRYASASGDTAGSSSVGDLTIGSVTMNGLAASNGGENTLYIYDYAYNDSDGNASAGNITVGDININAGGVTQVNASNYVSIYNYGYAYLGTATVGDITIGNITGKTGLSGTMKVYVYESDESFTTGKGGTGTITVGNVNMQGSKGADLTAQFYNYAYYGSDVGGVTVGNVTMGGGAAFASFSAYDYAQSGGDVGNVKVGNVQITAASLGFWASNDATSGNAGNVTVGNISLKGGDSAAGTNAVTNYAGAGDAGTVTVGNVTLSDSSGQTLILHVTNSATGTVGTETLGNISIALSNKDAAGVADSVTFYGYTNGGGSTVQGNIVAGNITIGSSGVTTKGTYAASIMSGHVTLDAADGNVTVGNITVTGGVKDTNGVADNFATMSSWLSLTAGGTGAKVTVGNIDYSGYAAASTIDAHAFAGAASIKGSVGGSTIWDNKGVNAITFSDTTKADFVYLEDHQTGVKDSGTAVTATSTALDTITGFATGDKLTLAHAGVETGIGGNGQVIQNTPTQDFATFLLHSEQQIDGAGNSAYVAVIGGNTYVALADATGKVGEIVEIIGTHTFTVGADASVGYDLIFAT